MEKMADTDVTEMSGGGSDNSQDGDHDFTGRVQDMKSKTYKLCAVCNDKALGYNFDAVTCESCKAFFRRNALKHKVVPCLFKEKCVIDKKTRRFCSHCRLTKCFSAGMKKNIILDDNERKARMAKVVENRQRRQRQMSTSRCEIKQEELEDATCSPDTIDSKPSMSPVDMVDFTSCSSFEQTMSPSRVSSVNAFSPVRSLVASPFSLAMSSPTPENRCREPGMFRQLSEAETLLLTDLTISYEESLGKLYTPSRCTEIDNYRNVNQLVNNSEIAVRRLIKFVKELADFRTINQDDQIASLKACVLNSLLLRSVKFYSVERDAWITANGEIPSDILKKATGYMELHEAHVSYSRSLKKVVGDNCTVYALLHIIVIFSPEGTNIKGRQVLSDLQDKYNVLLKHYLESEFSFALAREYCSFLIQKVTELKTLSEEHADVLLQANPMKIEPLMLEVLNLK